MNTATLPPPAKQGKVIKDMLDAMGLNRSAALQVLRQAAELVGPVDSVQDAFERVRVRSIGVEDEILAEEGGVLSDAQFASGLRVRSRTTVHNYREAGKIFGVPKGARQFVYPAWQIHRGALLPGLNEVLAEMGGRWDPMDIALFFLTPAEALEDARPLDLLRAGRTAEVLEHVKRRAESGA